MVRKPKVEDTAAGPGPEAKKEEKTAAAPASTRSTPEPIPPRKPLVTFDRWFASKKEFRPHWKDGMAAFTNTKIRRTVEEWDKVFEGY